MRGENELVGDQRFTYAELKAAWETLQEKCGSGVYDIRNGYSVAKTGDCCENEWCAGWNFPEICRAAESVRGTITRGDMEVYENAPGEAFPADHGIWFEDGRIKEVY